MDFHETWEEALRRTEVIRPALSLWKLFQEQSYRISF